MDRKVYFEKTEIIAKIAVVENGRLFRYLEIPTDTLVDNVYRGKVVKIATNGAFVDVGEQTDGFLPEYHGRPGDYLTVSVDRDGDGEKRPRLTQSIRFAGRYAVLTLDKVLRFSTAIPFEMRSILSAFAPEEFGVVFRSACVEADPASIRADIETLETKMRSVLRAGENLYEVCRLYENTPEEIAKSLSADGIVSTEFDAVKKNTEELSLRRVERGGIELVFDKTEAMTVVDVNDKRNFGSVKNADRVLLQVDLDAAEFIAEQIRLRNLGGLIAVDFVNVKKDLFTEVKRRFDSALKRDFVSARAEYVDGACVAIVTRKKQYRQ